MVDRIIWRDEEEGFTIQHGQHTYTHFLPDKHETKDYCRFLLKRVFKYNKSTYFDEETKTLYCPQDWAGWWIGKRGTRIKSIEKYSGWKIKIKSDYKLWVGSTIEYKMAAGLTNDKAILTKKQYIKAYFLIPIKYYDMFKEINNLLYELYTLCSGIYEFDTLYYDVQNKLMTLFKIPNKTPEEKYNEAINLLKEAINKKRN